jgi:hypothetical protein
MSRLGCRIDLQRIAGRVGRQETVGIPNGLVFSGNSRRRNDDEESVCNYDNVAPNVGVDGLECVGGKRIDVDQKLESLAAKQTLVDVTGDTP